MDSGNRNMLEFIKSKVYEHDETLETDVYEFISRRCERALVNSREYMDLQKKSAEALRNNDMVAYSKISASMQIIAESICYKAAAQDAVLLMAKQAN